MEGAHSVTVPLLSCEEPQKSKAKEPEASSSPRRGLNHCIMAPVGTEWEPLIDNNEVTISRSFTEKRASPRRSLLVDRLLEREKKNFIEKLVKIQSDGTVEVDLEKSEPVASELLELQSFEDLAVRDIFVSECKKPIPRLQIAILVVGTRGDVQPFLAIAKKLQVELGSGLPFTSIVKVEVPSLIHTDMRDLAVWWGISSRGQGSFKEYGHHVRLATHANFDTFVKSAGVDFYPLGGDPRALAEYMARNKGLIPSGPSEISLQRKQLKTIIESLLPACTAPDLETGVPFRAQAIIANPPAYGRPTREFPHPLARVPQSAGYWLSYIVVELMLWWGMRGLINDFRKRKLKLAPIAYFSMYRGSISDLPTGYMWSSHVVSKPSDWGPLVDVVGYCFLNLGSEYQPREDFVQWIEKGPKPIYVGFGSMPLEDSKKTFDVILEALKDTGQRGIIDRGWGNLGNLEEIPEYAFLLEECPHDWLFPQCSAVVHHGGAGTTATGLKAGCPTAIVPFFGDQFFWGDRIYKKGLGPAPIPISELTCEKLSNAIKSMLQPEVKSRAVEIAKLIESEDGAGAAVDAFHRHLPPDLSFPSQSQPVEQDQPFPLQWVFLQVAKWCCVPCGCV